GYTMAPAEGSSRHDCTTLGGNSGSVVLDLASGEAVGLHFAGLYQETNYAVQASLLAEYVSGKRWNAPYQVRPRKEVPRPPPAARPHAAQAAKPVLSGGGSDGSVTIPLPLTIAIKLGPPVDALPSAAAVVAAVDVTARAAADPAAAEQAAKAF